MTVVSDPRPPSRPCDGPTAAPPPARACCDICGTPGVPWHTVRGYPLLRCRACDHGWIAQHADDGHLAALYDAPYFQGGADGYPDYVGAEDALRRSARAHLDVLDRRHPQRGRLLDVGCAAGFLLDEARRRGWEPVGLERSAAMVEFAREQLGVPVLHGTCCQHRGRAGEYDAVTMIQVLEHVDSPVGCCLASVAGRLRPGGTLLVETWDAASWTARLAGRRWQQLSPPTVQHWFSERSLRAALAQAGFDDVAVDRPGKLVDLDRVLALAEQKYLPRAVGAVRRATRRLGLEKLAVRYPLDDLVRVVARRR
jgi:2-polyprenyl-3-methyl-5-hydroxy-6-metoxy-1,4-benzoquinol methylase